MRNDHETPVLAIDGGGTRCRIALRTSSGDVVAETGPANVSSDFTAAIAEIETGLEAVRLRSKLSLAAFRQLPAYAGFAGVTGKEIANRVAAKLPFDRVRVEDDRRAALRGAVGARDGFVAHCGTGSFVAAQIGGQTVLAGGWGPVLGDPSSAQWVGRQSLGRTLNVADGLAENTPLAEALMNRFRNTAGIVAFAARATPADFGSLAPDVTRYANARDSMATGIMHDAAFGIATTLRGLGWRVGLPICLTGGIGPLYAGYMPEEMMVDLTKPLGEPLSGGLSLAQDFSKEIADERC
ncbi:Glucosamine kinase GspK [Shimia sp. SK013]|uniref:BadF/BadG/BcrA/BcrD ATPase family protein n=1 Tax=Shimia sp. SK013 TaxID=1389006 RepID=UPI0006B5FB0F|nr:BadF/BadG/BcrA/BcrD ATPase family protein [Shimia sp. SK013]KPA20710.1 Glucosamine kinase GspK [Shimia sp. SK013]